MIRIPELQHLLRHLILFELSRLLNSSNFRHPFEIIRNLLRLCEFILIYSFFPLILQYPDCITVTAGFAMFITDVFSIYIRYFPQYFTIPFLNISYFVLYLFFVYFYSSPFCSIPPQL